MNVHELPNKLAISANIDHTCTLYVSDIATVSPYNRTMAHGKIHNNPDTILH